jgi:RNA polymerase sigma-70 factor (ECF subfamily)
MQEDKLLVKQTLSGDEQGFHRLIMKYYTVIYALIMSWVKNPEDAKDLTQEVFLEAYQGLASLRQPEQFNFWLKKIAKYHCQDWFRKRQEPYLELSEDMIYDTPSVDEMLILRETLAKVMKAIDELPESESQLLKERYLDDASYDDLESKHGLSQSALAMRLLRAKRHVREKIKLLSGVLALSWQDMAKKVFVGGIEAVKISAKVKFITIGVTAVLILGGAGVIVWHYQQPTQAIPESTINQTAKKASVVSSIKLVTGESKALIKDNDHIDKKAVSEKKQIEEALEWSKSLENNGTIQLEAGKKRDETKTESRKEIYKNMTREEVEVAIAEVDKEIYDKLTKVGTLYDEVMEITQGRKSCPPGTTAKEMWDECLSTFQYVSRELNVKHVQYALALGIDPGIPFRPDGWANELIKNTSMGFNRQ